MNYFSIIIINIIIIIMHFDLLKKTCKELRKMCKEKNITNYSNAKKDQLIGYLNGTLQPTIKIKSKELPKKCKEKNITPSDSLHNVKKVQSITICDTLIKISNTPDYQLNDEPTGTLHPTVKGAKCSVNGKAYEDTIYSIIKNVSLLDKPFNKQTTKDLGGSSSKNDLICWMDDKEIGIEAKKYTTPDWMQCKLFFNEKKKRYEASEKGKNSKEARNIFNKIIKDINLYNGKSPPFIGNNLTHDEWKKIKDSTKEWDDKYYDIPSDTIKKLYSAKGCYYIQISSYGLYHLGNDICNFGVPEFNIEQRLRIRIKVHGTENKKGFCSLSITAACQPTNIKNLEKSLFSLDNKDFLPKNLFSLDNKTKDIIC